MSLKELRLCMGCMSPLEEDGGCPACHYSEKNTRVDLNYLAPGSAITQRYLVGRLTATDPEGAWYVGYDEKTKQRVWVREYAPIQLIQRDEKGQIVPLSESMAQYKALLADFDDLCKTIMRLPKGEKVIPILDIVRTKNTVYAIYQYIRMISLESFLTRSGGDLSWRHTKKLLMPLYHTVANIHKAGLIHRGISPQTVMLDQTGALWLSCFTLAAARTNKSELTAQLYEGYAAPEQYQLNSWQGAWTDVYALGAITYRSLTGKTPPPANDRIYGDDLLEKQEAGMSEQVMVAINKALAVEIEDRTQTAEAYIAELLAHEGSNTAVYTTPARPNRMADSEGGTTGEILAQKDAAEKKKESVSKRPDQLGGSSRGKGKRRTNAAFMWFLTAVIATSCLAGFVFWLSTSYLDDLFTPTHTGDRAPSSVVQGSDFDQNTSIDENVVPKFVGLNIASIQSNAALSRAYDLTIQETFNSEYEIGVVYGQQPVEGGELPADKKITLFVSKGTEMVEMPVVVDQPLDTVIALLTEQGIQYQIIEVFNSSFKPGIVVKCDRDAGSILDKHKDTVILYIKKLDDGFSVGLGPNSNPNVIGPSSAGSNGKPAQSSSKSSSSKKSSSSNKSSSESDRLLPPRKK